MKLFHSLNTTVFSKSDENKEEIKIGLKELFPFDLKKEKLIIQEEKVKGFDEKIMNIFTILIKKQKLINEFAIFLFEKLNQTQKEQIIEEIETRIDDELYFYLRIDKKAWIKKKRILITEKGTCYHLKFKIAAYPSKKATAINLLKNFIENQSNEKIQKSF